jgi:hypothetical protein
LLERAKRAGKTGHFVQLRGLERDCGSGAAQFAVSDPQSRKWS